MEENLEHNISVTEVERRLEFVIMLTVFFPTLLYSLFKLSGGLDSKPDEIVLNWGVIVALFLTDYIVFQLMKIKLGKLSLKIIYWILLITIISFIVSVLYVSVFKNSVVVTWKLVPFKVSIYELFASSVAILIVTLWGPYTKEFILDAKFVYSKIKNWSLALKK